MGKESMANGNNSHRGDIGIAPIEKLTPDKKIQKIEFAYKLLPREKKMPQNIL